MRLPGNCSGANVTCMARWGKGAKEMTSRLAAQLGLEGPEGKGAHDEREQDAAEHDPPPVVPPPRLACGFRLRPC
jgi:hypothetical protein